MNVTFSSSNKKTIQYIVNYLYSRTLTAENINEHIKHIQNKYKVSTTVHECPKRSGKNVKTTMKIIMRN